MQYRKLGKTGLDCSVLGFGTWQIGGGRWKGLNEEESIRLLRVAVEYGINIFDVAFVYGQYRGDLNEKRSHSLELLGKAFQGSDREKVIYCLKLGQVDEYSHKASYSPTNLVSQFQSALAQLKTNYIDICLIHAPSFSEIENEKAISVLQTLQALGLIRFIGYSFEVEPEHAMLAITQQIDVIMLQYNIIDEECKRVFDKAMNNGIGVLVGGPYKRGYLTGQFEKIEDFPTEDNYWIWNQNYAKDKVQQCLEKVNRLKIEVGGSPYELRKKALKHILQNNGACSAIVGHRQDYEVKENCDLIEQIITRFYLQ